MNRKISINKHEFGFSFRHYWDSQQKEERPWSTEFSSFKLGFEFKQIKDYKINKRGKLLNCYVIGINLLVIKLNLFITLLKIK
jgi:hypothetical protein